MKMSELKQLIESYENVGDLEVRVDDGILPQLSEIKTHETNYGKKYEYGDKLYLVLKLY